MKELLQYMVAGLVNHPDEIVIDEQVLPDGLIILSISANQEDYGRIIGRQGMLIRALRTIIKARAIKEKKKVMVRVMTEDQPQTVEVAADQDNKTESVDEVLQESALDDNLL
ncbi:MAG: KH domain-containing protein [bacterium]|nr:KH domain-containing protein [bacterium]